MPSIVESNGRDQILRIHPEGMERVAAMVDEAVHRARARRLRRIPTPRSGRKPSPRSSPGCPHGADAGTRLRGSRVARAIAWSVAFLVALEALAFWIDGSGVPLAPMRVPYPHRVLAAFVEFGPRLAEAAWVTLVGSLVGLVVGVAAGWVIALVVTQSRRVSAVSEPYLIAAQMFPTVALGPILPAVFHDLAFTRVVVAAYLTLFTVSLAVIKGLNSATPEALDLMRSFAASRGQASGTSACRSRRRTSSRACASRSLSVVGEVAVELSSAQAGLGYLLLATLFFGIGLAYLFWATLITTLLLGLGLGRRPAGSSAGSPTGRVRPGPGMSLRPAVASPVGPSTGTGCEGSGDG